MQDQGGSAAAPRLRREYTRFARTLIHHVESNIEILKQQTDRRPIARLSDIVADLVALKAEFGSLEIDLKAGTFTVTTEPIRLEGIDLGPFRIRVSLDWMGEPSPYEVLALEPNPAADSSLVVHPHVQGETLCEGDGKAAIRRASEQGRIFDLCVIVRQILQTYHSGSADVPLSRWQGHECHDCARRAPDDESTTCARCEEDLCHDCAESCSVCRENVCSQCRGPCGCCQSDFCEHCLSTCSDCGESFCSACVDAGRCDACHNALENPDEETTENPAEGIPDPLGAATAADPAVLAVGVGQVPVPA
jgi:hypothetical protein